MKDRMEYDVAVGVIENCAGFIDVTSSAGEAWEVVQEEIARLKKELEDARCEIDESKTRLAEAEVQKCTSPFSDSPPCRGIQKCLDRIAEAEEELATVKKIAMQIVQVCYYAGTEGDLSDRINNQMLLILKEVLVKLEEK